MNLQSKLFRTIHPEVKVIDAKTGLVDYIASDETLDWYKEVIRASGWKFTHFQKNAPFVDSHDYHTIGNLLGKVIDYRVEKGKLIERVQWAIDVTECELARIGFNLTVAGYLKAVSVGFYPTKMASKWDSDKSVWLQQLKELGLHEEDGIRAVYLEQEQVELSACILGANPNALAKAYKGNAINDEDIETLSLEIAKRNHTPTAPDDAAAVKSQQRHASAEFLRKFNEALNVS